MIILICAVSAVAAGDATIDGHKFTIPDGYSLYNSSDDTVSLEKDDYHAITIILGDAENLDNAKDNLANMGYDYSGSNSYKYGDFDVVQQNYEYDDIVIYAYVCMSDEIDLIITLTAPKSEPALEGTDNPVTTILDSIK
ncbi:hypothetical protein [Methanobrevibacter sp.]|uniref:hypothetical protein n=1 Tax=Methanobrevibacter sp. TaxID=66852 RepID=UPI00388D5FC9